MSTEGGVQGTGVERKRAGWKKFTEIAQVLVTRGAFVQAKRGVERKSGVTSVLTCGVECWTMKVEDMRQVEVTKMER